MKKYCPWCMAELDNDAIYCSQCGTDTTISNIDSALPIGTILVNRYYVGVVLGQGGFGITYVGCDTRLEKKVAIKEYYPSSLVSRYSEHSTKISVSAGENSSVFEHERQRFIMEAQLLAEFSGDINVVDVTDIFAENNTAYMVMDYVEGENLDAYIRHNGKLGFGAAYEMLEPMLDSLSRVHAKGLIHRDISPTNIMVQPDRRVILIDFGSAREFSANGEKSLSVILKHGYAPVEQYQSKGLQGPWTDIYAVCATIYKMITGITPPNAIDCMVGKVLKKPSELGADISAEEEKALMKGLATLQSERYSSVQDMEEAFVKAREKKSIRELLRRGHRKNRTATSGESVHVSEGENQKYEQYKHTKLTTLEAGIELQEEAKEDISEKKAEKNPEPKPKKKAVKRADESKFSKVMLGIMFFPVAILIGAAIVFAFLRVTDHTSSSLQKEAIVGVKTEPELVATATEAEAIDAGDHTEDAYGYLLSEEEIDYIRNNYKLDKTLVVDESGLLAIDEQTRKYDENTISVIEKKLNNYKLDKGVAISVIIFNDYENDKATLNERANNIVTREPYYGENGGIALVINMQNYGWNIAFSENIDNEELSNYLSNLMEQSIMPMIKLGNNTLSYAINQYINLAEHEIDYYLECLPPTKYAGIPLIKDTTEVLSEAELSAIEDMLEQYYVEKKVYLPIAIFNTPDGDEKKGKDYVEGMYGQYTNQYMDEDIYRGINGLVFWAPRFYGDGIEYYFQIFNHGKLSHLLSRDELADSIMQEVTDTYTSKGVYAAIIKYIELVENKINSSLEE